MKAWLALPILFAAACACQPAPAPPKKTAPAPKIAQSDLIEFELPNRGEIQGACWVPQQSQLVASIKSTRELVVLTIKDQIDFKAITAKDHYLHFFTPVASPDGSLVVVDDCGASGPSEVFVYRTSDWSLLHRLGGAEDRMTPRWSDGGSAFYVASFQRAFKFDTASGKVIRKYETDTLREMFGYTEFADRDDPSIVSVDDGERPTYYVDLDTGERVKPKHLVKEPFAHFSPTGRRRVERTPDKRTYRVLEGDALVADFTSTREHVSQEFGFLTEDLLSSAGLDLQLISTEAGKSEAAVVFFVSEEDENYERETLDWAIILPDGRFTGSKTVDPRLASIKNARRDDAGVAAHIKAIFERKPVDSSRVNKT